MASSAAREIMELIRPFNPLVVVSLLLFIFVESAHSFSISNSNNKNIGLMMVSPDAPASNKRREFLNEFTAATILTSSFLLVSSKSADAGVIQREKCTMGEGAGCEDLADGNEYIRSLQKKSAENKAAIGKEAEMAYQMKNYPDYFASLNPPKYLVKKADGTFNVYDDQELRGLKNAGKIKIEKAMAKGGKYADLTQKSILVLVE
eukprot:CAMPEP_0194199188 /NCGR_PEP_ID=MMETSP0156-20130528/298_1 /TAXON_ID=33649 /ORGANISM="Thalassionema nitzschioides, Strain L26-B" /LENGTH=204 /DNA_ID=CAMNT_0038924045 /DNA_START=29 /DNA_END=643 /DNA_ORIENTATION=+